MAICLFQSKEEKKKKKKHLLANSELLLQGMISSGLESNPISIFSEKELEQASNNYHSDKFLYSGGFLYKFYKGVHQNRIILIKKYKHYPWKVHLNFIKPFIFEIVALSQINHINIVKLLGCCLETECPIQVYEFCFNRNLWDCIETKKVEATDDECRLLSWEDRLRVAAEIAYAVTYLHTAKPNAIIHNEIRSRNVLLDQNGVAKLFNLSLSISIPSGKTHVEAIMSGNFEYLAPDCFETDYVKLLIREDRLREIVEPTIWKGSVDGMLMNQKQQQQQQEFAKLAVRCTEKLEEERATMMEVTKNLQHIKSIAEFERMCMKEEQEKIFSLQIAQQQWTEFA